MIPQPRGLQDLQAIVLGRAGMDLYPAPHGTKTMDADTFNADLGGSAGNIAVALTRHGLRVGLAAPVSDDPIGRFVTNKLEHYGVEHLTPQPVTGAARTSLALAESRSENCEVVIYRNQAADFELTPANFAPTQVDRAPTLVATGTALALDPSRSTTIAALQRTSFGILDLDYRAYTWAGEDEARRVYLEAIDACQAVVGNDDEFGLLAGPGETGEDVAERLAEQRPGGFVVYKMGERGSVTFCRGRRFTTPIFAVDVLKPFGAGDAFMGGLLARILAADALEDAVDFASAAAAMVVSRQGCAQAMPTTDAVQAFIAAHKGR